MIKEEKEKVLISKVLFELDFLNNSLKFSVLNSTLNNPISLLVCKTHFKWEKHKNPDCSSKYERAGDLDTQSGVIIVIDSSAT